MNFRVSIAASLALAVSLVTGCATKPAEPVAWSRPATSAAAPVRIGVAITKMPKADTQFPGAGCLLCLAAAGAANSSLTTYANTLSTADLAHVKTEIAEVLKAQGYVTKVIDEEIDLEKLQAGPSGERSARHDFRGMAARHDVDKLAVVQVNFVGFERGYAQYFPTGPAMARVAAWGYVVDLKTNNHDWYLPVNVVKGAEGNWDEAPAFPGLTNAYFQAIEMTKDQLKAPLSAKGS